MVSFESARAAYLGQAVLSSKHTQAAYTRALELFFLSLGDKKFPPFLPLQSQAMGGPETWDLSALSADDEPLLARFAAWLAAPAADGKRPYTPATIEVRLAGVKHWLVFAQERGWLGADFSLDRALAQLKSVPQGQPRPKTTKAAQVAADFSDLLSYYAGQTLPPHIKANSPQARQWELTRLRNHALLQVLGETGGQVSAVLSLNVGGVRGHTGALSLAVRGKNDHPYLLHLAEALPALRHYLSLRPEAQTHDPLFISHDPQHLGQRMSRIIAWRVIQKAAGALGLGKVSPHDLRHWRAKQLIAQGYDAQALKERLGHRSAHTTRLYYGHWLAEEEKTDSP